MLSKLRLPSVEELCLLKIIRYSCLVGRKIMIEKIIFKALCIAMENYVIERVKLRKTLECSSHIQIHDDDKIIVILFQ